MNYKSYVKVFNETFYVDTNTGEGIDKVLKKIEPLLNKHAASTYISGYNFEDIKSELTIIAIEGIYNFDPTRDVTLSTFLHQHINNKKISKIKSNNKISNDAFALLDNSKQDSFKLKKAREELNFSQFKKVNDEEGNGMSFENTIAEDGEPGTDSFLFSDRFDRKEFELDLIKICSKLDPKTRKIIELIYFEDYSLKMAAKEVGIKSWSARLRLSKLAKWGSIKTIFGKQLKKVNHANILSERKLNSEAHDEKRGKR